MSSIYELVEALFNSNKYVIYISNTNNYDWKIYMFSGEYIQLDIQTCNSLTTEHIDVQKVLEYIDTEDSIKIKFICYYDDFTSYNEMMMSILNKIKEYYFEKNKNIIIKYKIYYQ